jgi:hypothetical protein
MELQKQYNQRHMPYYSPVGTRQNNYVLEKRIVTFCWLLHVLWLVHAGRFTNQCNIFGARPNQGIYTTNDARTSQ